MDKENVMRVIRVAWLASTFAVLLAAPTYAARDYLQTRDQAAINLNAYDYVIGDLGNKFAGWDSRPTHTYVRVEDRTNARDYYFDSLPAAMFVLREVYGTPEIVQLAVADYASQYGGSDRAKMINGTQAYYVWDAYDYSRGNLPLILAFSNYRDAMVEAYYRGGEIMYLQQAVSAVYSWADSHKDRIYWRGWDLARWPGDSWTQAWNERWTGWSWDHDRSWQRPSGNPGFKVLNLQYRNQEVPVYFSLDQGRANASNTQARIPISVPGIVNTNRNAYGNGSGSVSNSGQSQNQANGNTNTKVTRNAPGNSISNTSSNAQSQSGVSSNGNANTDTSLPSQDLTSGSANANTSADGIVYSNQNGDGYFLNNINSNSYGYGYPNSTIFSNGVGDGHVVSNSNSFGNVFIDRNGSISYGVQARQRTRIYDYDVFNSGQVGGIVPGQFNSNGISSAPGVTSVPGFNMVGVNLQSVLAQ
jgi:hypothetical protein